ncbi:hypothetical protein N7535_004583 [Penicillium sp. DV-2018c]|nr:hypothetical protein N7461_008163 [Penicillium sp. DV-2018c]KAJ5570923.1 hypothetical protein N7535_004583 [Penicillium sp. DV-2018c]
MTAPRSSSIRALRTLSQQPVAPSARRSLHITGVQAAQSANIGEKALSNHEVLQSRAMNMALRRINGSAFSDSPSRQFNTSRASKALNDSSTVDFVYMPTMTDLDAPPCNGIYTVSGSGADVPASAMSEVVDNHAVDLDPFSLTEAVGRSRVGEEIQRRTNGTSQPGAIRELWSGFLDDLMGPKEMSQRK